MLIRSLVARRLTKEQKLEIVKGYRSGKSATMLANEFSCSSNTVNRTVKGMVSEEDYISLKELRSNEVTSDFEDCSNSVEPNNSNIFQEISPLTTDFGFEQRTQKASTEKLSKEILPGILYIIVDKTVELEIKLIRELPDWSFLPEEEKNRKAINLFKKESKAKKNRARGQKVLPIANPNIFILCKPFLLSKGITRLVLEDQLIALD